MVERGAVVVAGATGYIGKSTVRESVRQGYKTVALVRNLDKVESEGGQRLYRDFFKDAQIIECDVSDPMQLEKVRKKKKKVIYSRYCIHSPALNSFAVDFEAN
jgi:short-subunit dehydrogenase